MSDSIGASPRRMKDANQARSPDADLLARDPILAEIVRRLVKVYQPERIYLFGSASRGDDSPDSDYDLLVVVPDDAPPERSQSRLAYEVLWGSRRAAGVILWQKSTFQRRARLVCSLPTIVLRKGEVLCAA